jgi:hypothetical protein
LKALSQKDNTQSALIDAVKANLRQSEGKNKFGGTVYD